MDHSSNATMQALSGIASLLLGEQEGVPRVTLFKRTELLRVTISKRTELPLVIRISERTEQLCGYCFSFFFRERERTELPRVTPSKRTKIIGNILSMRKEISPVTL